MRARGRVAASLALACALAACARTGDLGRPQPNIFTQLGLPLAGAIASNYRNEALSTYPWTDDEGELRDRAYRLVLPAHERDWFDRAVAELRFRDVVPLEADQPIPAYHAALTSMPVRSVASRYHRLQEDATTDRQLLGPFLATARRVREADRARTGALAALRDVTGPERLEAQLRIMENGRLIDWTCASIERRIAGYRFSLDHLVIEGPQREAILAERAVILLENDPKSFCSNRADLHEPNPYNPHLGLGRPDAFGKIVQRPIPIADEPVGQGGEVILDDGRGVGRAQTWPLVRKD